MGASIDGRIGRQTTRSASGPRIAEGGCPKNGPMLARFGIGNGGRAVLR
jgi:hypothetical protein